MEKKKYLFLSSIILFSIPVTPIVISSCSSDPKETNPPLEEIKKEDIETILNKNKISFSINPKYENDKRFSKIEQNTLKYIYPKELLFSSNNLEIPTDFLVVDSNINELNIVYKKIIEENNNAKITYFASLKEHPEKSFEFELETLLSNYFLNKETYINLFLESMVVKNNNNVTTKEFMSIISNKKIISNEIKYNFDLFKGIKINNNNYFFNSASGLRPITIEGTESEIIIFPEIILGEKVQKSKPYKINKENIKPYRKRTTYYFVDEEGKIINNTTSSAFSEIFFINTINKSKKLILDTNNKTSFSNREFFGELNLSDFEEIIFNNNASFSGNNFTNIIFNTNSTSTLPSNSFTKNKIRNLDFNNSNLKIFTNTFDEDVISYKNASNITIGFSDKNIEIKDLVVNQTLNLAQINNQEVIKEILISFFNSKKQIKNININKLKISSSVNWGDENLEFFLKKINLNFEEIIITNYIDEQNNIINEDFLLPNYIYKWTTNKITIESSVISFGLIDYYVNDKEWKTVTTIDRKFSNKILSYFDETKKTLNYNEMFFKESYKVNGKLVSINSKVNDISLFIDDYSYLQKIEKPNNQRMIIKEINFSYNSWQKKEISISQIPKKSSTSYKVYAFLETSISKLTLTIDSVIENVNIFQGQLNSYKTFIDFKRIKPTNINIIGDTLYISKSIIEDGIFWKKIVLIEEKFNNIVFDSDVVKIPDQSFENFKFNDSFKKIEFNNVKNLGERCFKGTNLSQINLPNGILEIGNNAFESSLITKINLPPTLKTIGSSAFTSSKLTSITIPNSVTSIGKSSFSSTIDLQEVIFPNNSSFTTIPESIFQSSKITNINLSNYSYIKKIDSSAFFNSGITSISLPNTLTSIGSSAFSNSKLTSITLPNTLTSIGSNAFYGTSDLTTIDIPNKVTIINDNTFNYSGITSISLPDSLTSIGSSAFSNSKLTSITIPNSVRSIGSRAFYRASNLVSISLPNNPLYKIISSSIFQYTDLQSIIIPNSITEIQDYAFYNTDIEVFNIPSSVVRIGRSVFKNKKTDNISIKFNQFINNINNKFYEGNDFNFEGKEKLEIYKYLDLNTNTINFNLKNSDKELYLEKEQISWEELINQLAYFFNSRNTINKLINFILPDKNVKIDLKQNNSGKTTDFYSNNTIHEIIMSPLTSFIKNLNNRVGSIEIPNTNIIEISKNSFKGLKTREIDLSKLINLNIIGEQAFAENEFLEKIVLPNSVKKIETKAFYTGSGKESSLESIVYNPNNSSSKIMEQAFGSDSYKGRGLSFEINTNISEVHYNAFPKEAIITRLKPKNNSSISDLYNEETKILDLSEYKTNNFTFSSISKYISFLEIEKLVLPNNIFVLKEGTITEITKSIKNIDLNNVSIIEKEAFLSNINNQIKFIDSQLIEINEDVYISKNLIN